MRFFLVPLIVLAILSVVAYEIEPAPHDRRIPLVWVTDDNPIRRDTIADFDARHPGIDLQLDPMDQDAGTQKVIVQCLGGVGPDIFDCYGPDFLASYVRAGIALDITDELKAAGIDVRDDVWPTLLPYCMLNGRIYGFPANATVDVLWFNKDLFIKAGVPFPKAPMTWQQFIPIAQKMTVRNANGRLIQYGMAMEDDAWKGFLRQWGGSEFTPDGTRCTLDSPQAIAAVQFTYDLMYKYRITPPPAERDAMAQTGGWGGVGMKGLASGRAATAIGGRFWLCTLRQDTGLHLGARPLPTGPTGQLLGYGKATLINRRSPRRQQAIAFIHYMTGESYNRIIDQSADGIGPMIRFSTDANLFNLKYPQEDYYPVFRDALAKARGPERCPFADAAAVDRVLLTQMDLVRANAKSPRDAMLDATRQVNELINLAIRRDPDLKRRYDALRAGEASTPRGIPPQ